MASLNLGDDMDERLAAVEAALSEPQENMPTTVVASGDEFAGLSREEVLAILRPDLKPGMAGYRQIILVRITGCDIGL